MDYRKALEADDPARALQAMTAAFNFERDILEKCRDRRLSRVVTVLDSGQVRPANGQPSDLVEYLIFELAAGDLRTFVAADTLLQSAWTLRTLHQAASALRQLHAAGIAHQDVKPSNVLVFGTPNSTTTNSKLADLGRASDKARISPSDGLTCAGDLTYAPPELLYRHVASDWNRRRLGCDLYLLGSIVLFFCSGVSMTHFLFSRLDEEHHFTRWSGSYEEVLPYLQHVFSQGLRDLRSTLQTEFADEVAQLIAYLCDPDPKRRGHPRNLTQRGNQYSLERFVSRFDYLATKAEYSLVGKRPLELRDPK